MALTGIDIFKQLPKTNCGDCGVPTCLAFAMKIAAGQAELAGCPHLSEEAAESLSEASAPPIRAVTIGSGDAAVKIGGELVLYRHDKTFYNPCVFAAVVDDSMDAAAADALIKQTKESHFNRIEQDLKPGLIAVKSVSGKPDAFAALVAKASSAGAAMVLMSEDPAVIEAGLKAAGDSVPLVYVATEDNVDKMAELALAAKAPLAVKSGNGLDGIIELTKKVMAKGIKDIVIDPGTRNPKDTLEKLVYIRRAALLKKVRELGYPTIVFPNEETADKMMEALIAGLYVLKYGSVIVMSDLDAARALPLYVLRQNIYTDPQRPMQVKQGIYPIGNPTDASPVMITSNFSLTYFIVSGEVEGSRIPSWLCVMDTEGLSVMTAWAAGKFVPEKITPFIKSSGIEEKVKHRRLVIPGYLASMSGELEDELSDWKIEVGPREAADIPPFLKTWS
ncbi:MAG: acetyl-CoA decarbonylase/synthase complex subunit gamma [Actinomycetota bacterium]